MRTTLEIENLKCHGCANTIQKELNAIIGVHVIEVNPETEKAIIDFENEIQLPEIKRKLKSLGYPEKGSVSGLDKVTAEAISYISCAIGKLNNKSLHSS